MTASPFQRWPEIDEIFAEVLDLPPERRAAFLLQRCEDPELRSEVQALVEAETLSRGIFGDSAGIPRAGLLDGSVSGRSPEAQDVVGSYRLLQTLGRGGSSTVYLAERADGKFRQRVAVKILDPSLMDRSAKERFDQERQILADLHHPNIARLLDGGVTPHGWPYIVMEYVDGIPIDRYCDEGGLSVRERLALVRTVCEAVHHAHTALVVHRDLKPGNVLVTPRGDVKLLDFGIAKILGDGGFLGSDLETLTGVLPMTPAFAAPEQIMGEAVTTTTDVYQLGSLIYHLLTGRRPFGAAATLAGLRERADRDGPDLPSRVVARADRAENDSGRVPLITQDVALMRGTTPSGLRRQLRGDLDTLILTAMRKDPRRRYSSVEALSADIQRYLDGRPLVAHPDSVVYRASKFLKRHPFSVPVSAAAGIALSVLSIGLVRENVRAEQERAKAEEVTGFIVGLFDRLDPGSEDSDTLTVKALLAEGAQRVEESLTQQPLVKAAVMSVIGKAYMGLGRLDDAAELMTSALEIERRELPEDDPVLGTSLHDMAELLIEKRNPAEAERDYREALDIWKRKRGLNSPEVAREVGALGLAVHAQGRYDEARALYEESLRIYREHHIPFDQPATETLVNLGWLNSTQGHFPEAEALFREALIIRRSLHGDVHASVASALSALAETERRENHLDSAMVHAATALGVMRGLFGDRSVRVVGPLLTLAGIRHEAGHSGDAENAYREALSVTLETLGPNTPDAARIRSDLGALLRERGDLVEAESMGRKAVATYVATLGPDHLFTGIAQHNLGVTLAVMRKVDGATSSLRDAIRVLESNGLGADPRMAASLGALGRLEVQAGESVAAEPLLRRAVAILEASTSPTAELATDRAVLGRVVALQGRPAEAEPLLRQAYTSLRLIDGTTDPSSIQVASWLADVYDSLGRSGDASRFKALARD